MFTGAASDHSYALSNGGSFTVSSTVDGTDTLNGVEQIRFGSSTFNLVLGTIGTNTLAGGNGADLLLGFGGNDIIGAGAGNDVIVWNASTNSTDGRDIVDGGTNTAAGDTFVVNGSSAAETFRIYTRVEWLALGGTNTTTGHTLQNAISEIVITRQTGIGQGGTPNNSNVIAELRNVEELVINTGAGSDNVVIAGSFNPTHLAYNTIHINDADGGDTVDITGLTSDHRIVFNTDANGEVIGDLRPQDIVNNEGGSVSGGSGSAHHGSHDMSDDDESTGTPPTEVPQTPPLAAGTTHLGTPDPDVMIGDGGDDVLSGGAGDDLIKGGDGSDVIMGGDGKDDLFGGAGHDMIFGDAGNDRIFAGDGDDVVEGGSGWDTVYLGAGDDRVIATVYDGKDVYWGDAGQDTLDYSAISANLTVDLGNGLLQHGSVSSSQSNMDTIFGFENVIGGTGNDTIIASSVANVMDGGLGNDTFVFRSAGDADGDTIAGFQPGDKIDLSGIDANAETAGKQSFVLYAGSVFTAVGQVMVTSQTGADGEHTIVKGHMSADGSSDFTIDLKGHHDLTASDFMGVVN